MLEQHSHLTDREYFKYVVEDYETQRRFESAIGDQEETDKRIAQQDRRIEVLEEQLYFARELIGAIVHATEQLGTKKELIKMIELAIEDSYFER